MKVIFAKFPLLSKIQTFSQRLLVTQTSNHHHCNWHAPKPISRNFQVILNSSSWSKTLLCIFKEQIWFPNMCSIWEDVWDLWQEQPLQSGE